nr:unnamed protein product [Spirometra erinaceieuropaei]
MDAKRTARHLEFVSNLTGGTIFELICLLVLPLALGFSRVLIGHLHPRVTSKLSPLVWDFLLVIAVFVLPVTLLSEYIIEITVIACTTAILLYCYARNRQLPPPLSEPLYVWRRVLRAYILLFTCVCIYAVDFPLFPRRFAKTEAYGVSLMDIGVGLISLYCGLSNVQFVYFLRSARPYSSISPVLRSTFLLVLLGASRTLVIKLLGFPEHVTEYGVHWNFFVTLAVLRLAGFLVGSQLSRLSNFAAMNALFLLSIACTIGHQAVLSSLGLEQSLAPDSSLLKEEARRSSLLLANAEGLVSLPGYFALFLWGMLLSFVIDVHLTDGVSSVKYKLLCVQEEEKWRGLPRRVSLLLALMAIGFLSVTYWYGEAATSRRFVNLPFICLQAFISYAIAAFTLLCLYRDPARKSSVKKDLMPLITIVSGNSMLYFLVSNIMTGSLNLLIDTLELGDMRPVWLSNACHIARERHGHGWREESRSPPPLEENTNNTGDHRGTYGRGDDDNIALPPSVITAPEPDKSAGNSYSELSKKERKKRETLGLEFVRRYRPHLGESLSSCCHTTFIAFFFPSFT